MAKGWYPVIDYLKCDECGVCIQRCPHNVYDKRKAPTPVVVNKESCLDHCHGCGDHCPKGAITYVGEDTGWKSPHSIIEEAKSCCCTGTTAKQITVDFLYLDLNTCERCMATDATLKEAISELSRVLDILGYQIVVNKMNITSREMAEQYRFLSSPTIRVNGRDICLDVKENACKSCGDLCGSDMDCRVFVYDGAAYDQPPKGMIINGILNAIYHPQQESAEELYALPKNLNTFFEGKGTSCCESQCGCSGGCQ